MKRLPDRSGIYVVPLCAMLCGWIASAMLIHGLFMHAPRSAAQHVIDAMLAALASTLGPIGVALTSVALAVPPTLWFGLAYRTYRARVAADRAMMK